MTTIRNDCSIIGGENILLSSIGDPKLQQRNRSIAHTFDGHFNRRITVHIVFLVTFRIERIRFVLIKQVINRSRGGCVRLSQFDGHRRLILAQDTNPIIRIRRGTNLIDEEYIVRTFRIENDVIIIIVTMDSNRRGYRRLRNGILNGTFDRCRRWARLDWKMAMSLVQW